MNAEQGHPVQADRVSRRAAIRTLVSGAAVALAMACGLPPQQPGVTPTAPQAQPTTPPVAKLTTPPVAQPTSAAVAAPTPTSPAAAKPAAAPKRGGTLRVGQVGDITNLDPHIHAFSTTENTGLSFDKLIAYDAQGKPAPMLAESWEMNSDATQLKLNLRRGVLFHTGRELTSDDVKYTFTRIRDPKAGVGQFALQGQWFNEVQTPDKYTAILKADQPRPTMFDLLEYLNIVDKDTLEGPDAKTKSIGTGPFKFVEWLQGDHITFEANKSYWQSGRPYLDGVRTSFFRDAQSMVVQLEAGALDLIRTPPLTDFARLKSNPQFQGITHPVTNYQSYLVGANTATPPLDNRKVRQALNYAIDRNRFASTVLLGIGTPQVLPWSESYPMYDSTKMSRYAFDLDKAKALLAEAGAADVAIDMSPYPPSPEGGSFAELYQADLAKIGVKLNIVKLETAVWTTQVNSGKLNGMYFAPSTNLHLLPGTLFNLSSPLKPNGNNQNFSDRRYTELVQAAGQETDPAKLKQVYSELNDILLDESFVMYLSPIPLTMVARAGVNDILPNMHDGAWLLTNTWLDA